MFRSFHFFSRLIIQLQFAGVFFGGINPVKIFSVDVFYFYSVLSGKIIKLFYAKSFFIFHICLPHKCTYNACDFLFVIFDGFR